MREARARIPAELPEAILGHSLGGLIVLRYLSTAEAPGAAVLSAPWLRTRRAVSPVLLRVARVLDTVWPSVPFPRPIDPADLTRDPGMQAARREDPLVNERLSPRLYFEVERAQQEVLRRGPAFPCPCLFVIPGADPLVDSDATRAFVGGERPGAGPETRPEEQPGERPVGSVVETLELPGLRHEPFNEVEREDVTREVGDWLIRTLLGRER